MQASSPFFWALHSTIALLPLYQKYALLGPPSSEWDTYSSCVSLGHQDLAFKPNVSDMILQPSIWKLNAKQWLLGSCYCPLLHDNVCGQQLLCL